MHDFKMHLLSRIFYFVYICFLFYKYIYTLQIEFAFILLA